MVSGCRKSGMMTCARHED